MFIFKQYNFENEVVCFSAPLDKFWSKPKKLTPNFYYFFTKKVNMKINHPKNLYLASTFFVKNL